jgi:hypothetical protein
VKKDISTPGKVGIYGFDLPRLTPTSVCFTKFPFSFYGGFLRKPLAKDFFIELQEDSLATNFGSWDPFGEFARQ